MAQKIIKELELPNSTDTYVFNASYLGNTEASKYALKSEIPSVPTVNNGKLTISVGTTDHTFTANQSTNTNINLAPVAASGSYNDLLNKPTIPSPYTLPLAANGTRGGIQIGYSANGAHLPVQLSSEKAFITLTKNGINSAGFNEAYLEWGGKNFAGTYAPIDAALNPVLSPNRLAGFKPAGVLVEYTNDGTTWLTYNLTDAQKTSLFTTSQTIYIGGPKPNNVTNNSKVRVTIDGVDGSCYTSLNKMHIYISTNNSQNTKVTMESYDYNSSTSWHQIITDQPISGWSGWNILNFRLPGSGSFGGTNSKTHQRKIRLTFSHTHVTAGQEQNGLQISKIYAYGGVGWTTPSTLAAEGTPYTYNYAGAMKTMNDVYPESNKVHSLGYSGNQWKSIYGVTLYENGTALSSKYLGISAKAADSAKLNGQQASYYLNYNNLTNKPTIPSAANNGILTISVDNNEVQFTADSAVDKSITIVTSKGITSTTTDTSTTLKLSLVAEAQSTNAATYTAGGTSKFYAVQLDKNNKLGVYVPWTDNTNTAHSHTNGVGLVRTGDGGVSGTVDYKVALASETLDTNASVTRPSTNANRIYPIIPDKNGKLAVIVPWSDTNTHYTTGLYIGVANEKTNNATSNNSTYIKLFDDNTRRSQFKISGTSYINVSSDANGNVTIKDTLSTATSSANGLMSSTDKAKLNNIEEQPIIWRTWS